MLGASGVGLRHRYQHGSVPAVDAAALGACRRDDDLVVPEFAGPFLGPLGSGATARGFDIEAVEVVDRVVAVTDVEGFVVLRWP